MVLSRQRTLSTLREWKASQVRIKASFFPHPNAHCSVEGMVHVIDERDGGMLVFGTSDAYLQVTLIPDCTFVINDPSDLPGDASKEELRIMNVDMEAIMQIVFPDNARLLLMAFRRTN